MDWKKLISELLALGMTQKEIASDCQLGQATISELMTGEIKELRWTNGEKLRLLHARKMRRAKKPVAAQEKG